MTNQDSKLVITKQLFKLPYPFRTYEIMALHRFLYLLREKCLEMLGKISNWFLLPSTRFWNSAAELVKIGKNKKRNNKKK